MNDDFELQQAMTNVQTEMIVLGTFYKEPLLSFSYTDAIKNEDFSDKGCEFFFQFFQEFVLRYSDTFTQAKANMFASENSMRLGAFRKFGGWKYIEQLMGFNVGQEELPKIVDRLKKYSLLRSLSKSYDVSQVLNHKKFNEMSADTVANYVRGGLDRICNRIITGIDDPIDLAADSVSFMNSYFEQPAHGIDCVWPFINERCNGIVPGDTIGIGALSNSGKGRSLTYLLTNLALINNVKTFLMTNEMQVDKMRRAMHVSVLNSESLQKMYGHQISITEERFKHGLYLDNNGNPIYRDKDKENVEQFINRLLKESKEYCAVKDAMTWLEERKNLFLLKDISGCYNDETMCRLVRQAVRVNGVDVWGVDTLKPTSNSANSWNEFVGTATKLTELNLSLNVSSVVTFQMADTANDLRIEGCTSSAVASAKHLYHLLSNMVMFLHLKPDQYDDYEIIQSGNNSKTVGFEDVGQPLDKKKRYVACNLVKNRNGSKDLFLISTDMNRNTWVQVPGILRPIRKNNNNKKKDGWL